MRGALKSAPMSFEVTNKKSTHPPVGPRYTKIFAENLLYLWQIS